MQSYQNQVTLLLNVLPVVAKEEAFALHGGTAINLFVRNMPRLSVDIDLTYLPLDSGNRDAALQGIFDALERIKANLESQRLSVVHQADKYKLQVYSPKAQIKVEVNSTGRGTLAEPQKMTLCERAQTDFDVFVAMNVVPFGQLFGGKICAALDRQHPRDLFDVKYLLDNEGFTEEVKQGFILGLISSGRPLHEIIRPNYLDQRVTMTNHFEGMSADSFSYEDFETYREKLIDIIHSSLTERDKEFLLSFKKLTPNWEIHDFERFPSVQWKLKNLRDLKVQNPSKLQNLHDELERKLFR
jgi:predicted nucleotidyltransferase component of viral defense system